MICPLRFNLQQDSIIMNKEIEKGVFVASSIIPSVGICHVKILNTNNVTAILDKIEVKTEPLSDYHILNINRKTQNLTETDKIKRLEKLLKIINIDVLDIEAKKQLENIIISYQHIFQLDEDKLTVNNFYNQELQLTDSTPVYIKNYRLPQTQFEEIDKQVKKLIEDDIVEPSVSPYNSPLLIVPKKSENGIKKWRLVVDFRQLNKKIVNDKFPLTRLEDVLDRIGRAKYFSTLDMTSSFHQINLDKNSRPPTAFSTPNGHYHFKRLPFGLKISSNSFQRMLTIALSGLDARAFIYVDDIIIFGCSLKHHNDNLIKVFQRLSEYNLKLNPNKCCFLKSEVVYLGHLITSEGIKTDPSKFKIIENYPIPKNAEEVKRFVAFCNYYRRFIKDFADIASPLNALSKKKQEFIWTQRCQDSFNNLKQKLMSPEVLKYPNFEEQFILTTDASNVALGAVLSQGKIGEDRPITYASKALNKHEKNKSVIEKELLAIHWGINFFRPYLFGRKFLVVTDHRPLVALFSHKNPSSKLTKIRIELSDYDFDILYKKGSINTNADALSRIDIDSEILKNIIPYQNKGKIDSNTLTNLIPYENDENQKRTLEVTRGMKKNIASSKNENDSNRIKNKI